MRKNFSIISLVAVGLFMISTFATSKFQTAFGDADKFGFPFVFFSAHNAGEVLENKAFSFAAIFADIAIYFTIAYAIVSLVSLLKVDRKPNNRTLAH
jgi:hypothetical protein